MCAFSSLSPFTKVSTNDWLPFLVDSFSREIQIWCQICSSLSGSRDTDVQSFAEFSLPTFNLGPCWKGGSGWKLSDILPCPSCVVTALANGATAAATATAIVSGLQQEPGLASGQEKESPETLNARISASGRARANLTPDLEWWWSRESVIRWRWKVKIPSHRNPHIPCRGLNPPEILLFSVKGAKDEKAPLYSNSMKRHWVAFHRICQLGT